MACDHYNLAPTSVNCTKTAFITKQLSTWHEIIEHSHHPFKAAAFLKDFAVCTLGHEMRFSHRITLINEQITAQPHSGQSKSFISEMFFRSAWTFNDITS